MDEKNKELEALEGAHLARDPMTDTEVDEVRAWVKEGAADTTMPVSFLAPRLLRLLDEIVLARRERQLKQNVYRVKFETRFNRGEWVGNANNVLANGSAEEAIAKVRKDALNDEWDDDGEHYRCTGFRLIAVERICEIDL